MLLLRRAHAADICCCSRIRHASKHQAVQLSIRPHVPSTAAISSELRLHEICDHPHARPHHVSVNVGCWGQQGFWLPQAGCTRSITQMNLLLIQNHLFVAGWQQHSGQQEHMPGKHCCFISRVSHTLIMHLKCRSLVSWAHCLATRSMLWN